ncbi:hypothetical protein BDV41DRAFT_554878 [Aspergillus transmontanensis]|uniref:Uncharacterized protein n=1 Tax=Aspergillus transmontanensis TaxID=1034304 RepID=A0A5N6VFW1_9EURO|nr:hypothetical protein BDV41DRAFT_554878 [Aspergillus transmontanensis]
MIPARGWWEAGAYLAELHLTLCLSLSLVSFSRRFHNSNHSFARSGLVLFIVFWSARAQYYCSSIIRSPSRSHTTLSPIHTETSRDVPKRPFQNPRSSSHSTTYPLTGSNRQSTETKVRLTDSISANTNSLMRGYHRYCYYCYYYNEAYYYD